MAKKINYAAMFTLRKDGRYMASYTDNTGRLFYDRDPERLYSKLQAAQMPQEEKIYRPSGKSPQNGTYAP